MSAGFEFQEDNGAATGSPAKGTTRTGSRVDNNFKNVDDSTTAVGSTTAGAIRTGNNSFTKYQFGKFTGTFNQISAGLWTHTATAAPGMGTGVTLMGTVTSTYATPSTATNASLTTDMTANTAIGSGLAVLFHTTGPEGASPTSTLSAVGYTQYLATQLQTTILAAPGDIPTMTLTLQYNEN